MDIGMGLTGAEAWKIQAFIACTRLALHLNLLT